MNGDVLVFMVENQGVVEWGVTHLNEVDPPVIVSSLDESESWITVTTSISQFALQTAVYCLKCSKHCRWWGNACVPREIIDSIRSEYDRLPFSQLHWPFRIQYFGAKDLFIVIEPQPNSDEHQWISVCTRTLAAATAFNSKVGSRILEWNVCSDEWPPGWVSASADSGG
jgi:hypothetical protein